MIAQTIVARSILLVTIILVVTACHQPNIAPAPGYADPYGADVNDPRITVHDEQLRAFLGFHQAIVTQDGQTPIAVEQPVRNLADQQYLVDYRVIFFDADNRELEPVMGWTFLAMQPKQVVRMKARSLNHEAVDYRIEVKWAK